MKEYDKYKDASIPWITAIPDHWDEKSLIQFAEEQQIKNVGMQENNLLSLSYGRIIKKDINTTDGLLPANFEGYQIVHNGNIILRLTDLQNDHKSLRTGLVTQTGIITSAYTCLKTRSAVLPGFLQLALHVADIRKVFYSLGGGVRQSIGFKDIRYLPVAVPPRDEQDHIVRFLDWKVSEINKLISVRKQQIVKLEELKRSEIGHLVMGQSKSVPQRETAIGWVKTIPSNWREKSLIQLAEEQQIKNIGMIENNLLSLSYGKIINKDINATDGLLPTSFEGYQIVHDGNIVLRLTDLQNDHKSLRTGLVTQTGIITSAYTCLKAREGIIPEYLQLQLHVADLCKVFYSMGGGVRQSIGFKDIRYMLIAVPSVDEQQRILALAHKIEEPIDRAVKNLKGIISILEEYKTKLIADVVTGKVDVRDIEIPEYELVETVIDETDENSDNTEDEES